MNINEKQLKHIIKESIEKHLLIPRKVPFNDVSLFIDGQLNEGIAKSYSAEIICRKLAEKYKLVDENTLKTSYDGEYYGFYSIGGSVDNEGKEINSGTDINIFFKEGYNVWPDIEKFMNFCGWYLASKRPNRAFDQDYNVYYGFSFEKEHLNEEKDVKLTVGYHLTPSNKVNKIMSIGLCPKHNDKKAHHPSRVYMFSENLGKYMFAGWANALFESTHDYHRDIPYTLLEIDLSDFKGKLYGDQNLDGAVFTSENIPPNRIKPLYEV